VTEFGPRGHWEVEKTAWGAPIEPTSTEKARGYLADYQRSVAGQRGRCLGAYAFLWGHKQEATATWFGMLLPPPRPLAPLVVPAGGHPVGGVERLGAADAMTFAWTGRWPANRVPELTALACAANGKEVAPGTRLSATVQARDPEGDPLAARWEVRSESADRRSGGDREAVPPAHPECILEASGLSLDFRAPERPGPYRLFVTLHDGRGGAATANIPFFVREAPR
jgi:hypothetical protein